MRLSVYLFSVCVWREVCIPEWLRVSSGHDVFEMEQTIHRELREADEAEFRDRVRLSTALCFNTEIKTLPSETDKEDIGVNIPMYRTAAGAMGKASVSGEEAIM